MTVSSNNAHVMLTAVRMLRRRFRKALRVTNCAMVMLGLSAKIALHRYIPLWWVKTFYALLQKVYCNRVHPVPAVALRDRLARKPASSKAFGGSRSFKDLTTR